MDDKEKRLSEILNTPRTPEQAQACYEKIQQRLSQEKVRKKLVLKRVLACAASLILICAAVLVPLLLKKDDVRYYDDTLITESSTKETVENEFGKLQIAVPIFDSSAELIYHVYKPKDNTIVIGAKIEFECLTDTNYSEGIISVYGSNVDVQKEQYLSYSKEIVCDDILYKYELVNMNDDMYTYQAYATTDKFTIIIKYRAFFDEFISFIDQLY